MTPLSGSHRVPSARPTSASRSTTDRPPPAGLCEPPRRAEVGGTALSHSSRLLSRQTPFPGHPLPSPAQPLLLLTTRPGPACRPATPSFQTPSQRPSCSLRSSRTTCPLRRSRLSNRSTTVRVTRSEREGSETDKTFDSQVLPRHRAGKLAGRPADPSISAADGRIRELRLVVRRLNLRRVARPSPCRRDAPRAGPVWVGAARRARAHASVKCERDGQLTQFLSTGATSSTSPAPTLSAPSRTGSRRSAGR